MARFYGTLLWEYVKNPWIKWLSLDKLSWKEFNYLMTSYDYITNKGKINFKDVNLQIAAKYSWEDVYITNRLFENQKKSGLSENKVLNDIELPLLEVIKEMEISWVKIDRDKLKEISTLLENEIKRLEEDIYIIADTEFNINSPKQVWEILFEKLWLPKWKKTKTGYSVSADVLWDLSHEFEIAQLIVDYRHYSKLKSTYADWLTELLDDNDFLHTNYNQAVTTTWRLSSNNPNLQNIPSSNWIAWTIREAFVSRFDWWKIFAIDYSQVEVRLLAILSWDENLIKAFNENIDIHHNTAKFLFKDKTITSNERKIAKWVNFWVIYWISWFWLSKMIWINMKDAKIYIDKFYESYPKVREYLDNIIKWCEENNYVETLFWRRRYINGINDSNKIVKSSAEREAINMPIQWTSADIIKIAMIKISKAIKLKWLKSIMIMQVHDELVFDIYPWEEDKIKSLTKEIMEWIIDEKVVLKTDSCIWNNWREAK